jgi:hypothetical protein
MINQYKQFISHNLVNIYFQIKLKAIELNLITLFVNLYDMNCYFSKAN